MLVVGAIPSTNKEFFNWHAMEEIPTHACTHTMELSRTPLRSFNSMHHSMTQLQHGVIWMQYQKHESDCVFSQHQHVFLLFCFFALLCCYLSLEKIHHLDWRCKYLFIFLNLHSPHPSPGCAVSRMKFRMKLPIIFFPVTTHITTVEKFLVSSPRTS
jgi:hypothetical protein